MAERKDVGRVHITLRFYNYLDPAVVREGLESCLGEEAMVSCLSAELSGSTLYVMTQTWGISYPGVSVEGVNGIIDSLPADWPLFKAFASDRLGNSL